MSHFKKFLLFLKNDLVYTFFNVEQTDLLQKEMQHLDFQMKRELKMLVSFLILLGYIFLILQSAFNQNLSDIKQIYLFLIKAFISSLISYFNK